MKPYYKDATHHDSLTLVSQKRLRQLLQIESLVRSLVSEDGAKEIFLSYNVGSELVQLLDEVRKG
jgi:hypothetical protein